MGGEGTHSVNNVSTLKETFKEEVYTFVCERVKYTKVKALKLSGTIGHEYLRAAKSPVVGRMENLTSCGCNLTTIDVYLPKNMRNNTSHKRYDHGHDSIVSRGRDWHTVSARWRAKKQSLNYLKREIGVKQHLWARSWDLSSSCLRSSRWASKICERV